jgi:hypothetical protein
MNNCPNCGPTGRCICPPRLSIMTCATHGKMQTPTEGECPACAEKLWKGPERRKQLTAERGAAGQPCTDAQLDALVDVYAAYMRARGVTIGKPELTAIRRAAAIQDAWRVAFAQVLNRP